MIFSIIEISLLVINLVVTGGIVTFLLRMGPVINDLADSVEKLDDRIDDVYLGVVNPRRLRAKKEGGGLVDLS